MRITSSLLLSLLGACNVSAFAPSTGTQTLSFTASQPNQKLAALPGGGSELLDLHQSFSYLVDSIASSSNIISDAVEAVALEEKEVGWWGNYLQLYKGLLETVHSAIDQPLRSVGFTQTWGVSIFLFTAGKYLYLLISILCHYFIHQGSTNFVSRMYKIVQK